MPEIMTVGWFPVLTLLLGYGTKELGDWIQSRRLTRRERETRRIERRYKFQERHAETQRATLLELQEAVMQLARATGAMHHQDRMAFRETGKWQKQLFPSDLDESARVAQMRTSMLYVRVADEAVRNLTQELKNYCTQATESATQNASDSAMTAMSAVFERLNQRIGELLRRLDDAEDSLAA